MTWEEVCGLHKAGFEIGNHTLRHKVVLTQSREEFRADVKQMERRFQEEGLPAPRTLAYPHGEFDRKAAEVLREEGYLFARRGVGPEVAWAPGGVQGLGYDPKDDHPLLVPASCPGPNWTLDDLVCCAEQAREGKIAVLAFHGVPDPVFPFVSTEPSTLEAFMKYLHDKGYTVVALRDLAKYVDPAVRAGDLLAPIKQRLRLTPADLKCEGAVSPQEMSPVQATFSWVLQSCQRGQEQSAHQILVASSRDKLDANIADKWDSGKVVSDQTIGVSYNGNALSAKETCWWKVRTWDKEGKVSDYSPAASFEVSRLESLQAGPAGLHPDGQACGATGPPERKSAATVGPGTADYRQISVRPHVTDDLDSARDSITTPRGVVAVEWKRGDKSLVMKVGIPANTTGIVQLPKMGSKNVVIKDYGRTVWKAGKFIEGVAGIAGGYETEAYVTLEVASGVYLFRLRGQ